MLGGLWGHFAQENEVTELLKRLKQQQKTYSRARTLCQVPSKFKLFSGWGEPVSKFFRREDVSEAWISGIMGTGQPVNLRNRVNLQRLFYRIEGLKTPDSSF
jgi:hypothetical protein